MRRPKLRVEKRADGVTILRSPQALKPYGRAVGDWLVYWYERAPDRTFIAERKGDGWRRVSYRAALFDARRIGQGPECGRAVSVAPRLSGYLSPNPTSSAA